MIDYQRIFHVGVRVPSLEVAMATYGDGVGVTWAEPLDLPAQPVWTPEDGLREVHLKHTYSAEGPQHLELLEGEAGSPWHGNDAPGAHHIGLWVDDLVTEAERLIGRGWRVAAAHQPPEAGYGVFVYLQPASGLVVELVDTAVAAVFQPWWAAALA